jgi:nucleoside-diphosphate-sugar epimerase
MNETTNDRRIHLVTGATGLLGSHIAEQLRLRGERVRALVRPTSQTAFLESIGVELVNGDLSDAESMQLACQGIDTVYHAAARVGDWGPWPEFVEITVEGTRKLVQAAEAAKVRRFLHISSISTYGHPDGEGLVLDESAPLGRSVHKWSYYTRAKVMAEDIVWKAHREGRIQLTVIRPSWLYGPRDRATIGRLVQSIRKGKLKIIGDGKNRLNVVHAGNVAEGAILATNADKAIGEAYNCSNDGVLTQRQYFDMIADALGHPRVTKSVPYKIAYNAAFLMECKGHLTNSKKPPLVTRYAVWLMGRRCFFSAEKARKELGWQSSVSYEEGIPSAVEEYLKGAESNSLRGAAAAREPIGAR